MNSYKEDFVGCLSECLGAKLMICIFATVMAFGFTYNLWVGKGVILTCVPFLVYIGYVAKVAYEAKNVEFIISNNQIVKHDVKKDKVIKTYVANQDFNYIELHKSRHVSRFSIMNLTGNSSPNDLDTITVRTSIGEELFDDLKKMIGCKQNKYSTTVDMNKTNGKRSSDKIFAIIIVIFTALATVNLYDIISKVILIPALIIITLFVVRMLTASKRQGKDITTTINNACIIIEVGNATKILLVSAMNILDITVGKETDDIMVHKSEWRSKDSDGHRTNHEFCVYLEGIDKLDTKRVEDMLRELK